jgi:hypothetical protein
VATANVGVHMDRDLEHLEREMLKLLGVGCQKTDEGMRDRDSGYKRNVSHVPTHRFVDHARHARKDPNITSSHIRHIFKIMA